MAEDSAVGYRAPSGTLDTGLSGSSVTGGTVVSGSDQAANGGGLALNGQSGTYTQVQQTRVRTLSNPGTTLTFTCSPTATATLTSGYGAVSSAVRYFVTFNPPLGLYLRGTTFDSSGNQNIMVGQVCTGCVFGVPAGSSATYQWSDPGGTTLQSWTPGSAPVAATWPFGDNFPSWYWNDVSTAAITRTVQCVVTVGGTPTTLTKTVSEQVPTVTATVSPGSVYINGNCPGQGGALFIYAGGPGMGVNAAFSTPAPFGPGKMELVQTLTPGDSYKTSDGKNHPDPNYGLTGLDTSYPAGDSEQAEPTYANSDSPGIPLKSYISSVGLYITFSDWLMYQPPDAGNGRYYVPRKTYGWNVASSLLVAQPAGGWVDEGNSSHGSVTITPACTDTNQYPTWTQTLQGQAVPWPASP